MEQAKKKKKNSKKTSGGISPQTPYTFVLLQLIAADSFSPSPSDFNSFSSDYRTAVSPNMWEFEATFADEEACHSAWYAREATSEDVRALLAGQPDGCFLVHLADGIPAFTLSYRFAGYYWTVGC